MKNSRRKPSSGIRIPSGAAAGDRSRFYNLEPDFVRPRLKLPGRVRTSLRNKLEMLYGKRRAVQSLAELERIMAVNWAHKTDAMIAWEKSVDPAARFTEKDCVLITYGDLVREGRRSPLAVLDEISRTRFHDVFTTIHILPFFPWSSDRGFAIRDFRQVDPALGTWEDINNLKKHFKLMFDGVINHISSKSTWFQEFLNGNPTYRDFFIAFDAQRSVPEKKLRMLVRPRTSSVLTPYETYHGRKMVWTTFSADQIDLKFQNPEVLLRIIEVLLIYVRRGADIIRLDAVTYLWDELGTSGAHLKQTHVIIRLLRQVLDAVAPHVALITETNVPHRENITYFGNGRNEAQLVYNFALPPLVLFTFLKGDAARLSRWASGLTVPSDTTGFFNFLDSHDGIGLPGVRDILADEERDFMIRKVQEHGGLISYKQDTDGKHIPYELNTTFFSALNRPRGESRDLQIDRYCAARAVALVIRGVPGVYLHGFLGSRNDVRAIRRGEENRSINRKVLDRARLEKLLNDPTGTERRIADRLTAMIRVRSGQSAFHPQAPQTVLDAGPGLFCVLRTARNGHSRVLAVINVTDTAQKCSCPAAAAVLKPGVWKHLLHPQRRPVRSVKGLPELRLRPYEVFWLRAER